MIGRLQITVQMLAAGCAEVVRDREVFGLVSVENVSTEHRDLWKISVLHKRKQKKLVTHVMETAGFAMIALVGGKQSKRKQRNVASSRFNIENAH